MPTGIFGLKKTYKKQVLDDWTELPEFGYFAYGDIDRLDLSNETVSKTGASFNSPEIYGSESVSNSNYGYFGGGFSPVIFGSVCTIDRLEFSNETTSNLPASLTQVKYAMGTVSNSNYGYFGGGQIPGLPAYTCIIDRLDFSNETTSTPGNNLIKGRSDLTVVSTPQYGYFGGGYSEPISPGHQCTIERLDFSNETLAAPGTFQLTEARRDLSGVSNPQYGYFAGGLTNSPPPLGAPPVYARVCTIDRFEFSNETVSAPATNLTERKISLASISTPQYGYFGGGQTSPLPTPAGFTDVFSNFERLDFYNETISIPSNYLSVEASSFDAVSTKPTTQTVRKLRRGVDVSENPISKTYGYFGGGIGPPNVCTIDRLDFSNETVSAPANKLTQARNALAAVSSHNYGYFGGGYFPGYLCTIDRLDFSNETTNNPPANLTQARYGAGTVSNSNYGYFAGGLAPPGAVNTIDRLDFSNETVSAPGTYQLTEIKHELAGVSNSNYGYFGGGFTSVFVKICTIDRLDFSNETVSAPTVTPGQLTQARAGLAAVSNSNYGYFGGGYNYVCTIDRLDFSNETVQVPPAPAPNQLTQKRYGLAAVSNSNYGYFGGGLVPPNVATIDRLDFSNETTSNPPANLTQARSALAAVSN